MKSTEMKSITNKLLQSFNYNQIVLKRSLGKGAFGQCFEIDWQENSNNDVIKMALKFIPGGIYDSKKELFNREIAIHQKMCNKYIVKLHKVNIDPLSGDVHMIMELCYHRSLADFINQNGPSCLKPAHMNRVCSGIGRGLVYLHQEQGIVHRDIKPANILLNEKMSPKISDFGLATTPEQCQQTKQKICGTPHYLAPEIFQQCGHSFQSDIWAYGVTLYFMIAGYTPFETQKHLGVCRTNSLQQTISLVYQNVIRGKYKFPKSAPICSKRFIKEILQKDPVKRPQLTELLEHTFYPTKSQFPETPDEDHYNPPMGFQLSVESVVFISDQPVIDAINNLCERMSNVPQTIEEIIWVNRWAMKTLFQFYYTLNNESVGGNIQNHKGIVITSDKKETHFQQEDQTLDSNLTKNAEELTPTNIIYYSDLIIKMLRPFHIPRNILSSLLSTLGSKKPTKSNAQNANTFVYKWFFHCESVIFLMSNGCWQISFQDHSKLFIIEKTAVLFDAKSNNYEIVPIEDWCLKNTFYLDIMRTLIYSIL